MFRGFYTDGMNGTIVCQQDLSRWAGVTSGLHRLVPNVPLAPREQGEAKCLKDCFSPCT
jgi:hypothetical protein